MSLKDPVLLREYQRQYARAHRRERNAANRRYYERIKHSKIHKARRRRNEQRYYLKSKSFKKCEICSKNFLSNKKHYKVCSDKCATILFNRMERRINERKKMKFVRATRPCILCGDLFNPYGKQKICGHPACMFLQQRIYLADASSRRIPHRLKCTECSREFASEHGSTACSLKCKRLRELRWKREGYWRTHKEKFSKCKICDATFRVIRYQKICGKDRCKAIFGKHYKYPRRPSAPKTRICIICSNVFINYGNSRTCGNECRRQYYLSQKRISSRLERKRNSHILNAQARARYAKNRDIERLKNREKRLNYPFGISPVGSRILGINHDDLKRLKESLALQKRLQKEMA